MAATQIEVKNYTKGNAVGFTAGKGFFAPFCPRQKGARKMPKAYFGTSTIKSKSNDGNATHWRSGVAAAYRHFAASCKIKTQTDTEPPTTTFLWSLIDTDTAADTKAASRKIRTQQDTVSLNAKAVSKSNYKKIIRVE